MRIPTWQRWKRYLQLIAPQPRLPANSITTAPEPSDAPAPPIALPAPPRMLLLSPPRLDPQELSHDNLPDIGRASQRRRRTGPLPVRTLRRLPSQTPDRRPLALALQGGGAHGALTWGVVDRLLQQPELTIAAISGSSAGALNALALAAGFAEGGAVGARAKLAALWHRVAGLADLAPLSSTSLAQIAPHFGIDWSPTHFLFETLTRYFSPYQFNPFGIDPLRQILIDLINIDLLRRPSAIRLYIGATQVDSGEARLFENAEITIDTILASACLPAINQAIRHNDTYYWDGGFSANPPVMPLVDSKLATDLIVVRVDPIFDSTVPVTADAIRQRLNRFMFNAPLNTELRLIDWLQSQAGNPDMAETEFGQYLRLLRLHVLSADDVMLSLSGMSKLRPDWTLIDKLHGAGLELAESWLNSQGIPPLGKDSTRPLHVQPETNQGLG